MYNKVLVKIGTNVLYNEYKEIDYTTLTHLVAQIAQLKDDGRDVVVVTSGAVGFGATVLGHADESRTIAETQVYAAVGQVRLMQEYSQLLREHGYHCAQMLVTKEDFRDDVHYHNMRACFRNMLRDGIIPIVNENDVVAVQELLFTDNDELAGLVAQQLQVDSVIVLTSVDGVFNMSPSHPDAVVIPQLDVAAITQLQSTITSEKTTMGRGGMRAKLAVTKKLIGEGITVHIASGKRRNVLTDILQQQHVGTVCSARVKNGIAAEYLAVN